MKFFLRKVKWKTTGEVSETVVVNTSDSDDPEVMCGEELISYTPITKEKAIELCGEDAIAPYLKEE